MSTAGKLYGTFIVEESLAAGSETVFIVRHRTETSAAAGVLKTVVLPRSDSLQPGVMAARRLDAIALQDRVASDWPEVAPILDRPTTREQLREVLSAGQAWFVTRRYDASLQKVLAAQNGVPLDPLAIWLVCRAVARGALAFQQVDAGNGRRSHGNLKLSNILIRGIPIRENQSEIVVTDPAPGGRSDQTAEDREQLRRAFEKDDLEALGRMLFQMTAGRPLPESTDWTRVWETPEGESRRWKKVFGPTGSEWRELCRQLLGSRAVADASPVLGLAAVEKRLGQMRPRESAVKPRTIGVLAGAAVLLAALILFLLLRPRKAELTIESSIPSVDLSIAPTNRPSAGRKLSRGDATKAPASFSIALSPGPYLLQAIPTGEFSHLLPLATNLSLNPKEDRTIHLDFDYSRVRLNSDPSGAEVQWRTANRQENLGRTPLDLFLPPDGRYDESEFQFVTQGYTRKTLHLQLTPGTNVTLLASLVKQQLGSITAEFRSTIDQGVFRKTRFFVDDTERTSEIVELNPNEQYPLTILPPRPWSEFTTNITFGPEPPHHVFTYSPPYGTLVLAYPDVDIRTASVWLRDENQEVKLGTVANEVFRLPSGKYTLALELDGYLPTNFPVAIVDGQTNRVPVRMARAR